AAVAVEDEDVLGPRPGEDRVGRVARPAQAVGRGGVAEELGRREVVVVAGVPQVVRPALAEDIAALADLAVPRAVAGPLEDRVAGQGRPCHEPPGEFVGADLRPWPDEGHREGDEREPTGRPLSHRRRPFRGTRGLIRPSLYPVSTGSDKPR